MDVFSHTHTEMDSLSKSRVRMPSAGQMEPMMYIVHTKTTMNK